jgi:hypothetical protein
VAISGIVPRQKMNVTGPAGKRGDDFLQHTLLLVTRSSHPSALGHIPFVAGGSVPPHFEQISFSSTMKAPFFDRLDDRSDEN